MASLSGCCSPKQRRKQRAAPCFSWFLGLAAVVVVFPEPQSFAQYKPSTATSPGPRYGECHSARFGLLRVGVLVMDVGCVLVLVLRSVVTVWVRMFAVDRRQVDVGVVTVIVTMCVVVVYRWMHVAMRVAFREMKGDAHAEGQRGESRRGAPLPITEGPS